jgi:hypothetical protein
MKKISLLYSTIMLCFSTGILFGQSERNIIFMHGLGGSEEAWIKYDEYFNATRKANPIRFSYTEASGIPGAVNDAQVKMSAAVPASSYPQNIVIAHSQGGIVTRGIAKAFSASQRPFGGFITVGTPNLGARVINSYKTGKFGTFTKDAKNQLLAGPNVSFLNLLPPWIPLILNSQIAGYVEDKIVSTSGIDHSTTNDFYVGAPYLTALNNYTISIPKVGIISSETTPNSHWKTLSSYTLQPVTSLAFNQEADGELGQYMQKAQKFYSGIMLYYRCRAATPIVPWMSIVYLAKAAQWEKGVKWFTSSEDKYIDLIGNVILTPVTVNQQACPWPCSTLDCTMNYSGCSWQSAGTYTYYQSTTYPTDGLVNNGAQYLPGAIENFVVTGPNHAQQRNHPGITEVLDNLFDGTIGKPENIIALSFFKVPKL